jgi:hypothetical protein
MGPMGFVGPRGETGLQGPPVCLIVYHNFYLR